MKLMIFFSAIHEIHHYMYNNVGTCYMYNIHNEQGRCHTKFIVC